MATRAVMKAQVELIGGEHDAGGQAREDDGDHGRQHIAQVLGADAALVLDGGADQQLPQGAQGLAALFRQTAVGTDEDQQGGHGQRDEDGRQTPDDAEDQTSLFTHGKPS